MSGNSVRTTLTGFFLGLWVAATATLIIMIKQGANEALHNVAGYVSNFPTLLFIEQLGLPGEMQLQVLFIYCAVVGTFLGWLAGMARTVFWALFVITFAIVIVSHWLPELVLEKGLLAAFEFLGHALIGRNAQ